MPDIEIRSIPRQHTAAIRISSPTEQIAEAMSGAFPKLYEAITAAGAVPAGPPLARYFSFGGPVIEFECAAPVANPFTAEGEVEPGEIGGGEAAVTMHVGPYDTIGETWESMAEWVKQQGREMVGPGWESYLTDPGAEPDPAKWMTEVFMPVK